MTTEDRTTAANGPFAHERAACTAPLAHEIRVDLMDVMNRASGIVAAATNTPEDLPFTGPAGALWQAGTSLLECSRYSPEERVANLLCLDALIASPDAIQAVLRDVRARLVEVDPELAALRP